MGIDLVWTAWIVVAILVLALVVQLGGFGLRVWEMRDCRRVWIEGGRSGRVWVGRV